MSRFFKDTLQFLEPYTPGEQPKVEGVIKLNTNENPYPPSPKVVAALAALNNETYRLYPDPQAREAVDAIAAYYGLLPSQVMLGNGSDEVLAFAYMAYGKKVYFPEVSYGFYPVFASLTGCQMEAMPMRELHIAPEDYKKNDGMVVLANPNAPTGMTLSLGVIEEILQANKDQVVIIDEAYVDFGGDSCVPLIAKYDNLLVVQTFSKSRSLAGMRVGMALASAAIIADLNRVKFSFNPYNLSREAIVAAKAAIEDQEYFRETTEKIIKTRQWFVGEMKRLGLFVLPSETNFVFVKTGASWFDKIRERNILLRHFDTPLLKDFVRITIGVQEDMEKLVQVMEELYADSSH